MMEIRDNALICNSPFGGNPIHPDPPESVPSWNGYEPIPKRSSATAAAMPRCYCKPDDSVQIGNTNQSSSASTKPDYSEHDSGSRSNSKDSVGTSPKAGGLNAPPIIIVKTGSNDTQSTIQNPDGSVAHSKSSAASSRTATSMTLTATGSPGDLFKRSNKGASGSEGKTYGTLDVDALTLFKKKRSMESFSSCILKPDVRPRLDRLHSLSKGEKILKSVLIKPPPPSKAVPPMKRKSSARQSQPVRFLVDHDGTDIASIRFITDQDEAPEIPLYATAYLNLTEKTEEEDSSDTTKFYRLAFSQPGIASQFVDRVRHEKVALESCVVSDPEGTVNGTVCVANVSYNKRVTLRYTINKWTNFQDVTCTYVYYASDGEMDRFAFFIQLPAAFAPGEQLEFCIQYEAGEVQFWDNNAEMNYRINCLSMKMLQDQMDNQFKATEPADTKPGAWLQFL